MARAKKPAPAHWYIYALGFWQARYAGFAMERSTVWWSGYEWEEGKRIEHAGQVLTLKKANRGNTYLDFLRLTNLVLASERFRDLVEALEPDVHQFFPVKMVTKSGELIPLTYFLLNVAQSFDCVIAEKSDLAWRVSNPPAGGLQREPLRYQVINSEDGLVLRKDVVHGRHMFRNQGKLPLKGCLFFSNELMAKLHDAKVKGVQAYSTREE